MLKRGKRYPLPRTLKEYADPAVGRTGFINRKLHQADVVYLIIRILNLNLR